MLKKIYAKDLKEGMFIAELDRPWLDTPFLIQGFLLEDVEQVKQLRDCCEWVLIDPSRSTGAEYEKRVNKFKAEKRDLGTAPRVLVQRTTVAPPEPVAEPKAAPRMLTPARPSTRKDKNAAPDEKKRSRDFVIETRRTTEDDAARQAELEAGRPAFYKQDNHYAAVNGGGLRGFFGQLRESVGNLFARAPAENLNFDNVPEYVEPVNIEERPAFIPETVLLTVYEDKQPVENEINFAKQAFDRTSEFLDRVVADIRSGNNLELEDVDGAIDDMVDSMIRNPDAMMWVGRLREQDLSTYGHGLSVAISLVAFGRHLGYPKEHLSRLAMIGLLLDIGKIRLPREILERKSRLTPQEFELVKKHVQYSLDILHATPNMHPDVLDGVAQHHERMDGSGYPFKLAGDKICVFGRMAAIADTYAAMTKERPYADTVSPHEALQRLSEWSGTQFQAEMVEQFIQSIGAFPVGSLVELSTGEVAVVVMHNKARRLRPKVLIVTDPDKTVRRHPSTLDLIYDVSDHPVYIRRGLPSDAYGIDTREYYLN